MVVHQVNAFENCYLSAARSWSFETQPVGMLQRQLGAACSPSRDNPDRRQQGLKMTCMARSWLQISICATSHSRTQEQVEPDLKLARSLHLRTRWPCDQYGGGSDVLTHGLALTSMTLLGLGFGRIASSLLLHPLWRMVRGRHAVVREFVAGRWFEAYKYVQK
jgi:hypothetical protein